MTKRAILYTRVSTDEQAEHGYSLQSQLEACRKYAAEHGYIVVAELSDDYSGAKLDRPELEKARVMLERKEAEAIIVYTADRLSRSLAHSLILREEWQRAGVELHYVDRGKAQDTAESRLTQNVEAVIAEFEREKIRERTRRGRIAKAQTGKWVGADNVPYGYRKIGQGRDAHLEVDEFESVIVRRIFAMYTGANGQRPVPLDTIAKTLTHEGVPPPNRAIGNGKGWYRYTLKSILSRRAYMGEFIFCGLTSHLPELAFIEPEVWQAAQNQKQKNRERARRNRKRGNYLLTGHITCVCGKSLHGKTGGVYNKYNYYSCRGSIDWQYLTCREPYVKAPFADAIVWNWVYGLTDDARLEKGIRHWRARDAAELEPRRKQSAMLNDMIDKYDRAIAGLAAKIAEALREENTTVANALDNELKAESRKRDALTGERDTLKAQIGQAALTPEKEERIRAILRAIRARIDGATFEQKREVSLCYPERCRLLRYYF